MELVLDFIMGASSVLKSGLEEDLKPAGIRKTV